jgi:hypothetical protein
MHQRVQQLSQDLVRRRNIDAYLVALISFAFAILSLFGDVVAEELRWAAMLAGVGLLVYRMTLPDYVPSSLDDLLRDRSAYDQKPLPVRLKTASNLWVFAPSGINLISPAFCEMLRGSVLARVDGVVRIVVLDPGNAQAVALAVRHLDDSLAYPIQPFPEALAGTAERLETMSRWQCEGTFEYRLLDYNPGFSMVAIDPDTRHGVIIVELHGFHNETASGRMHLELTRELSERWYNYWAGQFDHIWRAATQPAQATQM